MNPQFQIHNGRVLAVDSDGDVIQNVIDTEWIKLPKLPTSNSFPVESGSIKTLEEFGIKTVQIPAGSFLMGSAIYSDEAPQHLVTLKSFAMSETPITQAQWKLVAEQLPGVNLELNPNPSHFKGPDLPVEKVSWLQAIEFCNRMTQYTGHKITLPSEAQWEYACRAGTTTQFSFGDTIDDTKANYYDSKIKKTTSVHNYPPNPWGLYDMHGNVWEWCLDNWYEYYNGEPKKGSGWYGCKIIRGGSWYNIDHSCRSAYRSMDNIKIKSRLLGFRVVINP